MMQFLMRLVRFSAGLVGMALIILSAMLALARRQEPTFAMIAYQEYGRIDRAWEDGRYAQPLYQPAPTDLSMNAPRWSPDGSRVALVIMEQNITTTVNAPIVTIAVLDVDSGRTQRFTADWRDIAGSAFWSPDGEWLVFTATYDRGNFEIMRLHPASGTIERLTDRAGVDASPIWSGDGQSILFLSDREMDQDDEALLGLYRMNPDGSQPQRVTTPDQRPLGVTATTGSDWLILTTEDPASYHLYRIRSDGSQPQPLLTGADRYVWGQASPDQRLILVAAASDTRDQYNELYVIDPADGSRSPMLTYSYWGTTPRWSADGKWIYYGIDGRIQRITPDGSIRETVVDSGYSSSVHISPPIDLPFRGWLPPLIGAGLVLLAVLPRHRYTRLH